MKNLKAIALIIIALVMGLAAAAYATGWASRHAVSANKIVVAAVDVELGSRINAQMLTTADWPSGSVPEGAFTDMKALEGRIAKSSLARSEPVLERKLAPVGSVGGLSAVISEGKRAMTVRVNDVVGVAGFALPGTYVDVMVNGKKKDRKGDEKPISKTVLEKVLVLAVAQEASRDDTKPKVVSAVTLELTPADSEKLDLARSVGTLSLVLRNQIDKELVVTKGMTGDELFGLAPEIQKFAAARSVVRARPAVVQTSCVEILQDGARVLSCF